ncbi:MAG: patatin-like phospholipase family protein [Bacteroidia bacterium]|nr:patatin-like phospholipase family protein [Bacteroidia bacterium]
MKKFFRLFFNYYLVLKTCWFVVLFLLLGYLALAVFDQGQDILKTLSFNTESKLVWQTWFVYIAVSWWAWQSFRASRVILHFTYFNFWTYKPSYALRAQVFIPRLLATIPYFILAYAIYRSTGTLDAFVLLLISSGIWLFVFLHFRKSIIVRIRSWKSFMPALIPDYIPIKNGTYPARFIWSKQRRWFLFRIAMVIGLFTSIYLFPVRLPQYLGSSTIVLLGFGSWLILATVVSFIEKYLRFPVSFSILILVILFSFFNNNHAIRRIPETSVNRPNINEHFTAWALDRGADKDSTDFYLIMAEGGGLRSAYWTTSILAEFQAFDQNFADNIYAFSSVSGGSLGTVMFQSTEDHEELNHGNESADYLNSDLLAPITSALIFTDLTQKFVPFPVKQLDRARVLEKSFERTLPDKTQWQSGFLKEYGSVKSPVLMLNTTHVESGKRTVISNVDLNPLREQQVIDFFRVVQDDVPISTAIGASSRFPFITPPALVKHEDGSSWGNLVDGGYYENLGMQTMLDLYQELTSIAKQKHYKVRFKFIAIRNTKASRSERPMRGMVESLAPPITFSNIWSNNSNEVLQNGRKLIESNGDQLYLFSLQREDNENIPLGWYLSESARQKIDNQLDAMSDDVFIDILEK